MEEMTIKTFCERFVNGEFNLPYTWLQIEAGWYDWFCSDLALAGKTKKLGKKVVSIMNSPKFDNEKTYVFFKNNYPCVGPLYDQFSICDIETEEVLFCAQHLERGSHGCENAHWEVYAAPTFNKPAVEGTWNDCKKWFNSEQNVEMNRARWIITAKGVGSKYHIIMEDMYWGDLSVAVYDGKELKAGDDRAVAKINEALSKSQTTVEQLCDSDHVDQIWAIEISHYPFGIGKLVKHEHKLSKMMEYKLNN